MTRKRRVCKLLWNQCKKVVTQNCSGATAKIGGNYRFVICDTFRFMKLLSLFGLLSVSVGLVGQVKSPAERPVTDPKSLSARSNPDARPVAIDELFYSRTVVEPAWSPDGKEVVFT